MTQAELTTVREYCDAYAPRMRPGQFFSHTTAALLWNLPIVSNRVRPRDLHVSVRGLGRAPTARGVVGHSLRDTELRVERRFGHPVADVCTAWCQLAVFVSCDELIAAADAAVYVPAYPKASDPRPFTTIEELARRVSVYRTRGKRTLESALPQVRIGAASPRETRLRLLLTRAGLPQPELNVDVFNGYGEWAARADLFYRASRVVVEYDGDQHRTDVDIYENDQVRLERLADADCAVVRVRNDGLVHDSARTVARVRSALRRRGWTE
jgi:hypothetical protein